MAPFTEIITKTYYGNTIEMWAISLLIIVGAFIIGKTIYWIIGNLIKKLTSKTKTKLDDILVDMVEEPIMFAIVLFGIWYALSILVFADTTLETIRKAYHVLITLNITWLIARLFLAVFEEYVRPLADKTESDFDDQILPIVRKGITTSIWILGIIVALDNAGYKVGPLLAGLGIGGLAFAFAAKDLLANIFGGVTIFTDKPFKIKDRIRIDNYDGTIEEIGLRSTRIRTLDGTLVTIPNSIFAENPVENVTREPSRKIKLVLGLTYDTTPEKIEKAKKLLDEIANSTDGVKDNHKVAFTAFGDFSLGITFIYYIKKSADIFGVQDAVNLKILKEFNKAKLSFAFPTQTIELFKK